MADFIGTTVFDVAVVGLGGHGSATVAHLARRGVKVIGFERYGAVHANGSSYGRSRIIRQAYFEGASYVPLLQRSFELWRELDGLVEAGGGVPGGPMECAEARVQPSDRVLNMTGGLMIGLPDSELITGTLTSAREHGLPHEVLSADEVHRRFPVFCPEPEEVGVFDPEAGYLVPEMCNYAHSRLGAQHGAELHYEEPITQWRVVNQDESDQADAVAGLVHLTTANGEYYARKLVLTVGAWAPSVYSDALGLGLHVQRRQLCWFKPKRDAEDEPLDSYKGIPVYIWETDAGNNFYGFPYQSGGPGGAGVKIARHYIAANKAETGSKIAASDNGMASAGFSDERGVNAVVPSVDSVAEEAARLQAVVGARMPGMAQGELVHSAQCVYTLTHDEHFLIDFHPAHGKTVVLASPCSGHGFKFCSVVGEILADLAVEGETRHDIRIFRLRNKPLK